jgi:NTP pyrophosphatase (non-canonical NTP hydrolase)
MNAKTAGKIHQERNRQTLKWGIGQFAEMSAERVLAVLMEEVGEVAKCLLEHTDPEMEIIQVASVAARWLDECFSKADE